MKTTHHQPSELKTTTPHLPDGRLDSINAILLNLNENSTQLPKQLDANLNPQQQAEQAVTELNTLLTTAQNQLGNVHLQQAFAETLPTKTLQAFVQEQQAKGLKGDVLWQAVITATSQYSTQHNAGCFVGGTLVLTGANQNARLDEYEETPIEEIKVGDYVLSKPENGFGELAYKPVTKVFKYESKLIWYLKLRKIPNYEDHEGIEADPTYHSFSSWSKELLITPNHPVFVVGYDNRETTYEPLEQPKWARVDELNRYDVLIDVDRVMYRVERVQALYHYRDDSPDEAWGREYYYQDSFEELAPYEYDYEADQKPLEVNDDPSVDAYYRETRFGTSLAAATTYDKYDWPISEEEFDLDGFVCDVAEFEQDQFMGSLGSGWVHSRDTAPENRTYTPFTRTVYNIEVADNHTYFAGKLLVHNTSDMATER